MTLSTLLSLLAGSEFLETDTVVFYDATGGAHTLTSVIRTDGTQTTLPSGVAATGPVIGLTIS